MIELTPEQRHELTADPPRALDPHTRTVYVLLPEEVYQRLQDLLAPERLTHREQQALLSAAGWRAGWDDPAMDVYDREDVGRGAS